MSSLSQTDEPRPLAVACHALVEARASEIEGLRDAAGEPGAPSLPARFLRHSDEQTVVGIHAVLRAAAVHPGPRSFDRHGVVAASCQPGRTAAARTLVLYRDGGPKTVSPHVVPQASLHSIAGAVSVGLAMHGPHLGVSGGPDALGEGILAAVALLAGAGDDLPGIWVIVSEWAVEPTLTPDGGLVGDPVCRGLAFALTAADGAFTATLPTLAVRMPRGPQIASLADEAEPGGLADFARALEMCAAGGALVSWAFTAPGGAEIRVGGRTAADDVGATRPSLREAA